MPDEPVVQPVVEPVVVAPVVQPVQEPAAPVVQAVAEPVVEPIKAVPDTTFAESASATLTEAGLDANEIISEVNANNGEVSVELYNKLLSKLGAAKADLLVSGYKQEVSNITARQDAENNKVFDLVGGKAEWDKIAEWTKTDTSGLSKEAAVVYNEMLAAGGVKAALAAKALKEAYMASPGFEPAPNLMQGDGAAPAAGTQLISRAEYTTEKQKAFRNNDGAAVQALEARAKYTMQNHANIWRTAKING